MNNIPSISMANNNVNFGQNFAPTVKNIAVDNLHHSASLLKELVGKDSVRQVETMIRDDITEYCLSKKVSDAISASRKPQIKITIDNIYPNVETKIEKIQ